MVRLILFGMFRGGFQRENKFSPHAFRTDDRDVLFVLIDDLFHNRQTEAVALSLAAAGGVGFIKPIPYFVQRIGRDAHAVIFHGDKDLSVTDIAFNFYGAVVPAELDRIINKVVQHLLDLSEIGGGHFTKLAAFIGVTNLEEPAETALNGTTLTLDPQTSAVLR